MIGFVMLSGAGVCVIAAVVLLPAYASRMETEYRRDCLRSENADRLAELAALEKLERDLRNGDEVLIQRHAESTLGLRPDSAIVDEYDLSETVSPPPLVRFRRQERPDNPSGVLIRMGQRLKNPATRRGLSLLAVAMLVAAMFLFQAPQGESYRRY